MLQELLEEISRLYAGLPSPAFRENLHAEYLERLYRFREWSAYSDGREFTARITGVNDYGQLMLERKDGEMLVYGFKEVTYLP